MKIFSLKDTYFRHAWQWLDEVWKSWRTFPRNHTCFQKINL